jgi:hypothetical protein
MPGFGSGSFGSGGFGAFDWAKQVLFYDLPAIPDRSRDKVENGGDESLERWSDSVKPLFDELLTFAHDFEQLRDPESIRTQYQDNISVRLVSAEVEETGRTVRVEVFDPDANDPLNPLGRTSVGWILTDSDGREFIVTRVHKLSNAIIVVGNILPTVGAAPTGDAVLRPSSLIELLGSDYGIEVDRHDPEVFQRAAVRNAWQWFAMKGAERAYEVIGLIAGYVVNALPLWRICDEIHGSIPVDHIYEIPPGSGKFYTDRAPTRPLLDEVAADVVPLDMLCWETPDWTTDVIEPPPGPLPDGTSVSDAIGSYTQGLTIVGATDLGVGLWQIEVNGAADLSSIAAPEQWYATFPAGDAGQFWLESTPVDLVGSWTFTVMAGTAPTFGATVNIDYECQEITSCCYCKASAVRVEVTPGEILNEPTARLDGALERLRDRILGVVPVHVRITDIAHVVGPVDLNVGVVGQHLILDVLQTRSLFAYMPVGYFFDIVPADELETDPSHLVMSGTQYTVP